MEDKDTRGLVIRGEKTQNIGLRKAFHKALKDHGATGIAINNPYNNTVNAFVKAPKSTREKVYNAVKEHVKSSTGKTIKISEKKGEKLQRTSVSKQKLMDVANQQFLLYLMKNPSSDRSSYPQLTVHKAESDMMPRFNLRKKNGRYIGSLTEQGKRQLLGKTPHYGKFRARNLETSMENALSRMHPKDASITRGLLDRTNSVILD